MSRYRNELYEEIPNEVLDTDLSATPGFVHKLISSTVPPRDYNKEQFSKTILPLTHPPKPTTASKRVLKRAPIPRKIKNKLKIDIKCPKTGWNYKELKPLRTMWTKYMHNQCSSRYLNLTMNEIQRENRTHINHIFARADYHGAEMKIIRSKNPSLVGISGTCIVDSQNTFKIVSEDNKCRTIPKQDCVFEMNVYSLKLTVYGKLMAIRPAERSTKKLKALMVTDL